MLRVFLVDDQAGRIGLTLPALEAAGCQVHVSLSPLQLSTQVASIEPDAVIISIDSPDRDTLEHICVMSSHCPRPVVMFTDDADPQTIRAAIQAGVVSYVVAGLDPLRLRPILDVAISRFRAFQAMHDQLAQAQRELEEKKLVDQAKRSLIRQLGISEEQAYQHLRKLAMDCGTRLPDAARKVIGLTRLPAGNTS
ncbi:MAG TPA: ANTAR domain-containing protein [Thiobacillaceae bacterium]|nr:ANTAR domain-containing protein [Thiobacillaceae bacterium]